MNGWSTEQGIPPTVANYDAFSNRDNADSPADEAAAAKLWAVYVSEAEKYDKALVETWRSDMQGMLIFVRFQILNCALD